MRPIAWMLLLMGLAAVARGAEPSRVLLLPFAPLGEVGSSEWIGQAVQQNLLNDLSRFALVQPVLSRTQPATLEIVEAQKAGQAAGAAFVIFGTYQLGEAGLRLTGQVLDVRRGQLVGGLKATGTLRDLFALEDTVAEQARRVLSRQVQPPPQPVASEPPAIAPAPQTQQPMPWERDADWLEQFRLRPRYDDAFARSRYWYIYGTGPYWYGYGPGWSCGYPNRYYYGRAYRSTTIAIR